MISLRPSRIIIAAVVVALLSNIGLTAADAAESAPAPSSQAVTASQSDVSGFLAKVSGYTFDAPAISPTELTAIEKTARAHANVKGAAVLIPNSQRAKALNGSAILVSYGLAGSGVDPASNISIVFDSKHKFVSTEQVTFTADGLGGGNAQLWTNGTFVIGKTITAAEASQVVPSQSSSISGIATFAAAKTTSLYNKFSACLARMGVPAWLLGLAASLCGVSCALTLGAACVVCAVAVLVGFGTVITYCAWYASTH